MKTLKAYINEAIDIYRINEVIATYFVNPNKIILQCPSNYSESDIQIYIDDLWIDKLPSNKEYANKFFGVNADSIVDVHFEYDSFEHIDITPEDFIEWDASYDANNASGKDLNYFVIKNLKYIITFDKFDLTNVDDNNVKYELYKIFESANSNSINKYPIEIKFDRYSLVYRK